MADKRSGLKRAFGIVSMVVVGSLALATPALAQTMSDDNISFSNSWESENPHAASAGGHSVTAKMLCDTSHTPTVELVQDFWFQPNDYLGQKSLACQGTRTVGWSSDDSGDHFLIFRYPGGATIKHYSYTFPS